MKVQKILVPMDFSDCALNALGFAKKLASKENAELLLMNVSNQPLVHVEAMGAGAIMEPIMVEYEDQTKKNFEELIKKERLDEVNCSTRIYTAGFMDAVNMCLQEESIDLIITGTHEDHDFLDSLFGSRSADIINIAKVPVLMIPEKAKLDIVKKIGVAINFELKNELSNLDITKHFANVLNAEIVILNITDDDKKLFHHDDDKVTLSNYYGETEHLFFTFNDKGDLVKILKDSCDELKLDILFMHPKKYGGLESLFHKSLTKSMALQSKIALLTMHE